MHILKLLYIWIEEFRNIKQQGFVVDNEYRISIDIPDGDSFGSYDNQGTRIYGATPSQFRKVFYRKFNFEKNNVYAGQSSGSPIKSIMALVGENASGKSSILECVHRRADQFNYRNEDSRYFLLVFLDTDRQAMVVRTRDIWLLNDEDKKRDLRNSKGYEEYVFPLSKSGKNLFPQSNQITKLLRAYP